MQRNHFALYTERKKIHCACPRKRFWLENRFWRPEVTWSPIIGDVTVDEQLAIFQNLINRQWNRVNFCIAIVVFILNSLWADFICIATPEFFSYIYFTPSIKKYLYIVQTVTENTWFYNPTQKYLCIMRLQNFLLY